MTIPRVTEILKYFTSYDKVDRNVLANAAVRGTCVHALCAGIAKGNWIPDSMINAEYLPYVNSFRKWNEAQVLEYQIIEKRFTHESLQYSGQMDFVIIGRDGERYLVDIKTSSSPQKTYPLQMGAYELLLNHHNIEINGAMIVYLSKFGEFPEIDFLDNLTEQRHVFLSALDCYKYLHKRRMRGKQPELISKNFGGDG